MLVAQHRYNCDQLWVQKKHMKYNIYDYYSTENAEYEYGKTNVACVFLYYNVRTCT